MNVTYQRIARLVDDNSFVEKDSEIGAMAVVGTGRIQGRPVFILAFQSAPFQADAVWPTVKKMVNFLEQVLTHKYPLVFLHDNPVAPDAAGGMPLSSDYLRLLTDQRGMGRIYCLQARISGIVPTVSLLLGKVASAQAFPVTFSDASVMLRQAGLCMGRPNVVREMVGEDVSFEALGGAEVLSEISGVIDKVVDSEKEAIEWTRSYLSYFPDRAGEVVPQKIAISPSCVFPQNGAAVAKDKPFPMRGLIDSFIDADSLFEIKKNFAGEVITGLARVEGMVVGIIANNSACNGGILFPTTCQKMRRFVQLCNVYGIPLLFLADVPGLMIGTDAERSGIVKAGGELFASLARATVKKMCVVTRKAYTGGLFAMAGPGFDADLFVAFPEAEIGVYDTRTIERVTQRQTVSGDINSHLHTPETAVKKLLEQGLLDGIIAPPELRLAVGAFLRKSYHLQPDLIAR